MRILAAAVLAIGVLALVPTSAARQRVGEGTVPVRSHGCQATWRTALTAARTDNFQDVYAHTNGDVWAVGWRTIPRSERGSINRVEHPLIAHWDGHRWTRLVQTRVGSLASVVASSARNVWAVGGNAAAPLVEHFDGRAWVTIDGPHPAGNLLDLAVRSPRAIWATDFDNVFRWDGHAWTALPPVPRQSSISEIALFGNELWGAGDAIWRYRANRWRLVAHVPRKSSADELTGQDRRNGWVAVSDGSAYAEHWNGRSWRALPSPPVFRQAFLTGITGTADHHVWVIGNNTPHLFAAEWDGSQWTDRTPPSPPNTPGFTSRLDAVSASGNTIWVAGAEKHSGVVLRYGCG